MVSRRQPSGSLAAPRPNTLDQDGVMLLLATREQALQPLAAHGVKITSAGEHVRQFLVDDVPIGASSFGAVCDFLDVPSSFMRKVPLDLANKVATRMLKENHASERELVLNAGTNAVVGTRPKGQKLIPAARVFEKVFGELPETNGIYYHESPTIVETDIVCRSLEIEPRKGDVVRGGLSCLYSEVDTRQAAIRAYSERLVCTNGMTHREFDRDFGMPENLEDFLEEIGLTVRACTDYVKKSLQPKLVRATEFEVDGPQAIRRIFKQARLSPKLLDPVLAAHAIEGDGTAYGVLQAFTRAANTLRHEDRARLQALAGDELTAVEGAHCPHCYAVM
jgi:hypothetical protein